MSVVYSHLPFTFDYYLRRTGSGLRADLVAGRAEHIPGMRDLIKDRAPAKVFYVCTEPYPENPFVDFRNTELAVTGIQQFLRVHVIEITPRT